MECLIYFISSNDDDGSNGCNGMNREKESQSGHLHSHIASFFLILVVVAVVFKQKIFSEL